MDPSAINRPARDAALLERLAREHGTPFWVYDAGILRKRIREILAVVDGEGLQARFAMKSCPATRVLHEMRRHGIWLDTVSGNEVLRGIHAGFSEGNDPPEIFLTCDLFRDNALQVILEREILPNLGSPAMVDDLAEAGYRGPVSLRLNPGFGHGHVNSCDTGGPSSKHGIWPDDLARTARKARQAGMNVIMLHAHIGSGPRFSELIDNLSRLAGVFADLVHEFPELEAVSMGGGFPHDYHDPGTSLDMDALHSLFLDARQRLTRLAGRPVRLEIEPGRYFTAPSATLVARVHDVKETRTNEKGPGVAFAMVDAGFVDLVRPAMYGSHHRIEIPGAPADAARRNYVVAGPLCESGDVFTRDDNELLLPRSLPELRRGNLLCIEDAGAYGYSMASNYNSIGRAPQIWIEEDGTQETLSRRETVEDILRLET